MAASPILDALAHVWQALTPLRLPVNAEGLTELTTTDTDTDGNSIHIFTWPKRE